MPLKNELPKPSELVNMEPEDVAVLLLVLLNDPQKSAEYKDNDTVNLSSLIYSSDAFFEYAGGYSSAEREQTTRLLAEAWSWLEREGLIARYPNQHTPHQFFITRRGKKIRTHASFETYRRNNLLPPQESFDPALAEKVAPSFLRGDYDLAVLQAFEEIEVRVREAAGLPNDTYGTNLMREAFDPKNGRLTDSEQTTSEKEATAHLFGGAIGLFKNPSSHKAVEITSELIHLANFMLRLIGSRTPAIT